MGVTQVVKPDALELRSAQHSGSIAATEVVWIHAYVPSRFPSPPSWMLSFEAITTSEATSWKVAAPGP